MIWSWSLCIYRPQVQFPGCSQNDMDFILRKGSRLVATAVIGASCILPPAAIAQVAERGVGVADRARPDYDPAGIRAGGFIVYPQITSSVEYTDNLFAQSNNEVDDMVYSLTPEVRIESQWSRHGLNVEAGYTTRIHQENDSDDVSDYRAGIDGRLDVTRDTFVTGRAGYQIVHEERGSPDLPGGAAEPAAYEEMTAEIAATHRFNRLSLRPGFSYTKIDFDDVPLLSPAGGQFNNDDRDRQAMTGSLRVAYEASPALDIFSEGRYHVIEYDNFDDTLGGRNAKRDSKGYDVLAGASFDVGGLARGELAVGYTQRDYESPFIPSLDGFIYEGGLAWFVTDLTTINLLGARSIEETTIAGASGNFSTSVGARIDHELLRNVLIGAGAAYTNETFEGAARADNSLSFGADATYLINRSLRVGIEYAHETRDSGGTGSDYTINSVILSLRAAL